MFNENSIIPTLNYALEGTSHIMNMAKCLGIPVPDMEFCAHIMCAHGATYTFNGRIDTFPERYYGLATGAFLYEHDKILIALKDDSEQPLPLDKLLFYIAHELRHAYQKKYDAENKSEIYKSSSGYLDSLKLKEYRNGYDEIDADAWAAAYLEKNTKYRPHIVNPDISSYFDNKRKARMKELKKEYFPYQKRSRLEQQSVSFIEALFQRIAVV